MIGKDQIFAIIEEKLKNDNVFIVELNVSVSNDIVLYIDSFEGVNISYCVDISRLIEHTLDREVEDFQLMVSSAGIGPFKVKEQYQKYEGKEVLVKTANDKPREGVLSGVTDTTFSISFKEKIKEEGKKKKIEVMMEKSYQMDQIISVEPVIKF